MKRGLGSQKPKLAQGFYEIEDVRKKRVRKGHTEYLIKWRDWPERSNTWEPAENVQEYVDEFEESLLLRKRKRKRKGRVASKSFHREGNKGNETNELGHEAPSDEDVGTIATQQTNENEIVSSKVTDLRETSSIDNLNSENGKKKVLDIRLSDNLVESHIAEVDFGESTTHSNCLTGAKRRKSGNVRRFRKESTVLEDAQNGDKSEPDQHKAGRLSNNPHSITHENESVSSKVTELTERTSIENLNSENGEKKVSDIRLSDNMVESHIPEVDFDESTTHSNRLTGAKRRKSGNVRRFRKESTVLEDAQNGDKSEPDQHKAGRLSNNPHSITHENESVSSKVTELTERTSIDNLNSENGEKKVSDIRLSDNMVESHIPEVDFDESTTHINRLTGAKRRKSGNVRRFRKESTVLEDAQNGDKSEPDQHKA
ncbi:hypothetical protein C5167_025413 [Papaver somniferum]|uniref:Chromo domain-containing protein n=1 Tax=Papaver somniferum TaxID=3469 RepID=A0A4Y7JVA0_PAPSO|nr:hypothetical protein C5167_025413 [Papaver somniferum]